MTIKCIVCQNVIQDGNYESESNVCKNCADLIKKKNVEKASTPKQPKRDKKGKFCKQKEIK